MQSYMFFRDLRRCATLRANHFLSVAKNVVFLQPLGEMAEWSIAAVLKTVDLRGSGGSNPSLSAKIVRQGKNLVGLFLWKYLCKDKSHMAKRILLWRGFVCFCFVSLHI